MSDEVYTPENENYPHHCDCTCDDCSKTTFQCADISLPIDIKPNACVGPIETECCEDPVVCCKESRSCDSLELKITQKICVKIPIKYEVCTMVGESTIKCDPCEKCEKE